MRYLTLEEAVDAIKAARFIKGSMLGDEAEVEPEVEGHLLVDARRKEDCDFDAKEVGSPE